MNKVFKGSFHKNIVISQLIKARKTKTHSDSEAVGGAGEGV